MADAEGGGLTLEQYATAKKLPVAFLQSLGVTQGKHRGLTAVRMAFFDVNGVELDPLWRVGLEGKHRLLYDKKAKTHPYGLNRLDLARAANELCVVEGVSDAQTLMFHDVPALGLPGNRWRNEWGEHVEGIATIYVLIEPGQSGAGMLASLETATIRDRVKLVYLPGNVKDVSTLHCQDGMDGDAFTATLRAALDEAEPYVVIEAARQTAHAESAWSMCADLASMRRILPRVVAAVRGLQVVGERRAIELLYLATTSRLLPRPVSVVVKGPSSAGKSYLAKQVLKLFPASAAYAVTGMSEKALAYLDESLAHRMLVIYEAAGLSSDFASYLVRSLLSEGHVRYLTNVKTKDGIKSKLVELPGPTGLIVTTTAVHLHPENETRLLSLHVTDTTAQTEAVVRSLDAEAAGVPPEFAPWHALQEWLAAGETRVVIPFSTELLARVRPVATRLRRDVAQVLALLRAHALLHRHTRPQDAQGRIVADLTDYAVVHRLLEPLVAAGAGATVPRTVRETVAAVQQCPDDEVKVTQVAAALGLDKSAALRRVERAIAAEYLVNLEDRKGRPARLKLGTALPEDLPVLPPPGELRDLVAPKRQQHRKEGATSPPTHQQPCNPKQNPLRDEPEEGLHAADGCKSGDATPVPPAPQTGPGCNGEFATAATLQPLQGTGNVTDSAAVAGLQAPGGVSNDAFSGGGTPCTDCGQPAAPGLVGSQGEAWCDACFDRRTSG
jgi:hypothetical protein